MLHNIHIRKLFILKTQNHIRTLAKCIQVQFIVIAIVGYVVSFSAVIYFIYHFSSLAFFLAAIYMQVSFIDT